MSALPLFSGKAALLEYTAGRQYLLRSGAVVRLLHIDGPPAYRFLVGEIVRTFAGEEIPETVRRPRMSWCPDGNYTNLDGPNGNDIVAERVDA